jgi:hypothetical protein
VTVCTAPPHFDGYRGHERSTPNSTSSTGGIVFGFRFASTRRDIRANLYLKHKTLWPEHSSGARERLFDWPGTDQPQWQD